MRIICLTDDATAYQTLAEERRFSLLVAQDISGLLATLASQSVNGIILESVKMMRASSQEKRMLGELLDTFPHLRVHSDKEEGEIRPLGDLDAFFQHCREFEPRAIRTDQRFSVAVPCYLSRGDDPRMKTRLRTHTVNISQTGLFIYTAEDFTDAEWAWVAFPMLAPVKPVLLKVCWARAWGMELLFSGIGGEFSLFGTQQYQEFCKRFLLKDGAEPPDLSKNARQVKAFLKSLGF